LIGVENAWVHDVLDSEDSALVHGGIQFDEVEQQPLQIENAGQGTDAVFASANDCLTESTAAACCDRLAKETTIKQRSRKVLLKRLIQLVDYLSN
jgi:hypothetical protein